jgi:hypothetical protein
MSESRGRPFEPGNKVGRGRPKGSRNKAKSEVQEVLDQYTSKMLMTCIGHAAKGNPTALRLCIERMIPTRREAPVRMRVPPIRTAEDVDKAAEQVTQDIGRGKTTAADGEKMMHILESRCRIIDSVNNAGRMDKLEKDWAAAQTRTDNRK